MKLTEVRDFRNKIKDYSKVYAFRQQGLEEVEKPDYIPTLDFDRFKRRGCRVEFKKIGDNDFILYTNGINYKVDLDILALTQDYYLKLAKEKQRKENERAFNNYVERRGIEFAKRYCKKRRVSTFTKNKASHFQIQILSDDRLEAWRIFRKNLEELEQKLLDLELETIESNNTYSKGEQTSYGDSGLNAVLFDSHGVKIKRQNGNSITFSESDLIKESLNSVFSVYGDLSAVFKEYGLKISYSGNKNMHARKAAGLFFPHFKAIGTCKMGIVSVLAHEIAHFMDYYTAKKSETKRCFSSDEAGSTARRIARAFKIGMNEKTNSKYYNRSCECFARAFEQFVNPDMCVDPNYCKADIFKNEISPMIKSFLDDFKKIVATVKEDENTVEIKLDAVASGSKKIKVVDFSKAEQLTLF